MVKYILELFENDKSIVGVRPLQDTEFQQIADKMKIPLDECKELYRKRTFSRHKHTVTLVFSQIRNLFFVYNNRKRYN